MPSGEIGTVRSMERDSEPCSIARAGDSVAVSLQGIDPSRVMSGGVLCHPSFPVSVAKHLELKVLILDVAPPILIGSQVLHFRHVSVIFIYIYIYGPDLVPTVHIQTWPNEFSLPKHWEMFSATKMRPVCIQTGRIKIFPLYICLYMFVYIQWVS